MAVGGGWRWVLVGGWRWLGGGWWAAVGVGWAVGGGRRLATVGSGGNEKAYIYFSVNFLGGSITLLI